MQCRVEFTAWDTLAHAVLEMLVEILTLVALIQTNVFAIDDSILEDGSNGTSVVLLSVADIEQSTVFPDDNGILRRIAYVETRDGTRDNNNIWALTEETLLLTQDSSLPTLNVKLNLVAQEFNIDWISVELDDLRRPLYSGIAACLLLFRAPEKIPDSNDIEGQADFWKRYYNTNGSLSEFTGAANELEGLLL